jgi:hypothetical protein
VHAAVTADGIPAAYTFTAGSIHDLDGIRQIPLNLAALGKVQGHLLETIQIMRAAGGKSIFNRDRNTNIMTNSYREAVNGTGVTCIQRFNRLSGVEEEFGRQFACAVHSTIKPAFAQHIWHQSGGTGETQGTFHITAKIHGGHQDNGSCLRIVYFAMYGLLITHGFQYIIKKCVYCSGFYNRGQSSFLLGLNTTKLVD